MDGSWLIASNYGEIAQLVAIISGLIMAWAIGATCLANAVGTALSTKLISTTTIVTTAIIFEAFGAYLGSQATINTLSSNFFSGSTVNQYPDIILICMICSLVAAGTWILFAHERGWLVSNTQSIVVAMLTTGVLAFGVQAINWPKVATILACWVLLPLLAAIACYHVQLRFLSGSSQEQPGIKPLFIIMVALLAFAHGSNDVANVLAPVQYVINATDFDSWMMDNSPFRTYAPGLVIIAIVLGLLSRGRKQVTYSASRTPSLSHHQVITISLITAILVYSASFAGITVSVTQIFICSIIGISSAAKENRRLLQQLGRSVLFWLVTLPACALLSALLLTTFQWLY